VKIPILSLMTLLPLLAAFVCVLVRKQNSENARRIAGFASCINLFLAVSLWIFFDEHNSDFQFYESHSWVKNASIDFQLGVDGISLFFIILSALLSTLMIFGTWYSVKERLREYSIFCLVLQTFMIGCFAATNLFLFYIFFEGVLIPMFLIIGIWGGDKRIYATLKFFLYTFFGSVFMLLAILKIYTEFQTLNFIDLQNFHIGFNLQILLFLGFAFSFMIKTPIWPLHTWLSDAHVEAPSGGSVLLAGILLKMGGYGFIRFCLSLFPEASQFFAPYIIFLSVIGIIWASLIAFAQSDIKRLIAYSSIAHMGIVTLGIFSFRINALVGSVVQMISHGLVSSALFFSVGMLYDRFHTREINNFGGILKIMPNFGVMFIIFIFASIGLPFTSGFVGEILILIDSFSVRPIATFFACFGMVFGAAYMLTLVGKLLYGKLSTELGLDSRLDIDDYSLHLSLKPLEKFVLIILSVIILVLGVYTKPLMVPIRKAILKHSLIKSEVSGGVNSVYAG
jgi:NADH-quinone oxidoreductase subunit M